MKAVARIGDLASAVRSKNAGIYYITFDIMFEAWEHYRMVRDAGVITQDSMAKLFAIPREHIVTIVNHDPGQGIKITVRRSQPSGSPGDTDVLGCQQHAPLYDIEVPLEDGDA